MAAKQLSVSLYLRKKIILHRVLENTTWCQKWDTGKMATFHIAPPENFDFSKPDDWPRWQRRFERFRIASGLSKKDESNQMKKRNVIFERAKFNQRSQQPDETVESFITSFHTLAEHCSYEVLREQMIRDRIVVGLRDGKLAEKLQLLTLDKAVNQARQSEGVKKQQAVVRGLHEEENNAKVDAVSRQRKLKPRPESPTSKQNNSQSRCGRCGRSPNHPQIKCPARDASCHHCKKKGHFKDMCRSKRINEV